MSSGDINGSIDSSGKSTSSANSGTTPAVSTRGGPPSNPLPNPNASSGGGLGDRSMSRSLGGSGAGPVLGRWREVVVALAVLFVVTGIGYSAYEVLSKRSDVKAAQALFAVESEYLEKKKAFKAAASGEGDALAGKEAAKEKSAAGKKPTTTAPSGDLNADYGPSVQGLENVMREYAQAPAGTQAAILLAELQLEYKQPEKAVATLDQALVHRRSDEMLFAIGHLLRGTALAEKGDCQQAISAWGKVAESKENAFLRPEALLKSAVCHENLNQTDEAQRLYKRVSEEFPESGAAQTAKTMLRALRMRGEGHGNGA